MRTIIYTLLLSLTLYSCTKQRTFDIAKLTVGMTAKEVESKAGSPRTVLYAKDTPNGYLEVYEYQNNEGERYILEFWDNYLSGYEYFESDGDVNDSTDGSYIPVLSPPIYVPRYGESVQAVASSNRLSRLPDCITENQNEPKETITMYTPEMQAKLLQKIEELTLYVIKQDEKIQEQTKQIQSLRIKLEDIKK